MLLYKHSLSRLWLRKTASIGDKNEERLRFRRRPEEDFVLGGYKHHTEKEWHGTCYKINLLPNEESKLILKLFHNVNSDLGFPLRH